MVYVGTVATSDGDRIRTLGAINDASIHAQIRALPGNCQVPLVLLMLNNWCLSRISVRSVHYICILHPTATTFKLYFAIACNRFNVGFIHFPRHVNTFYNIYDILKFSLSCLQDFRRSQNECTNTDKRNKTSLRSLMKRYCQKGPAAGGSPSGPPPKTPARYEPAWYLASQANLAMHTDTYNTTANPCKGSSQQAHERADP